jgi:hypothetical protein
MISLSLLVCESIRDTLRMGRGKQFSGKKTKFRKKNRKTVNLNVQFEFYFGGVSETWGSIFVSLSIESARAIFH